MSRERELLRCFILLDRNQSGLLDEVTQTADGEMHSQSNAMKQLIRWTEELLGEVED